MKALQTGLKIVLIAVFFFVFAFWSTQALAGAVSLTLTRSGNLINVDDAAGRYQYEGGVILKGSTNVGTFAITRRVTFAGTNTFNTAMTTVTLFFGETGLPPQNVTLLGAHGFSNGRFFGSVAGASNRYTWIQGANAQIIPSSTAGTSTLTLSWTGSTALTLP